MPPKRENLHFIAAGRSEQGPVRADNQDSFIADVRQGIFGVADGIGGHRAGAVAAQAVIKGLVQFIQKSRDTGVRLGAKMLREGVLELSANVRQEGRRAEHLHGMGSTLAALLVQKRTAYIVNMGDSRVYFWRKGLKCLTRDHSLTALLLREGEISATTALAHPGRSHLTRFLGMEQDVYPDVDRLTVKPGDRFLLCTDGLWGAVPDNRIAALMAEALDPEAICDNLVKAAIAGGGQDNVTCVLVELASRGLAGL